MECDFTVEGHIILKNIVAIKDFFLNHHVPVSRLQI
jgi:hypothetical protein